LPTGCIIEQTPTVWNGQKLTVSYNIKMPVKSPIFPGPRTARGTVLAVLLSGANQTGAEPLRGRVTLAAIVRSLKRKYHWPIETTSFPSNAADGRATWATVYSLPSEVIARAMKAGADDWLKSTLVYRVAA